MERKLKIQEMELEGKRILLRVDLNLPLDEEGRIIDSTRLKAIYPTLHYLQQRKAKTIILSHLGRPKGVRDPRYSLKVCLPPLEKEFGLTIDFVEDIFSDQMVDLIARMKEGTFLLLENLRFYGAEEKPEKDPSFIDRLASYGDCYINDGFAVSHRAHGSVKDLPERFPQTSGSGFLLQKEMEAADSLMKEPERPFAAIVGGAKISTKIDVLAALLRRVDLLFIGGAMAFTFLKVQGVKIGKSLYESGWEKEAERILELADRLGIKLFLPNDIVVTEDIHRHETIGTVTIEEGVPDDFYGVDIGEETIRRFVSEIKKSKTLFWNGPLGIFELPPFDQGTYGVAKALEDHQGCSVIGGGDIVAAFERLKLTPYVSHISTGGGAFLEYLAGKTLPGIAALTSKALN